MVKRTSQAWPGSGETSNCLQVLVYMYLLMVFIMIFFIFLPANWVKIGTGLPVKHEINNFGVAIYGVALEYDQCKLHTKTHPCIAGRLHTKALFASFFCTLCKKNKLGACKKKVEPGNVRTSQACLGLHMYVHEVIMRQP